MRPGRSTALLAIVLLVSGCAQASDGVSGGQAASGGDAADPGASAGPPPARAGAAAGTVTDDEGYPLANVTVSPVGLSGSVRSDVGGAFMLAGLPAGPVTVSARLEGYVTQQRAVNVEEGATARLDFSLTPDPVQADRPYHETWTEDGFFDCSWRPTTSDSHCGYACTAAGCVNPLSSLWTQTKDRFPVAVGPGVDSVLNELVWESAALSLGDILKVRLSYENRTSTGHYFCSATGESPLVLRWDRNYEAGVADDVKSGVCASGSGSVLPEQPTIPRNGTTLLSMVGVGGTTYPTYAGFGGLAYQQDFDITFSVFYWKPAPAGFTGLE
jgi:hypothetical protein